MTLRYATLFALASLSVLGCKDKAPAEAEAPTGPPPETVQYPLSAAHATYSYFDGSGRFQTVRSLDELPASARGYTAVSVGQKTPNVEGKLYILDMQASDERIATARLMARERVEREGSASYQASELAFDTWEMSLGLLGAAPDRPVASAGGRRTGSAGGGRRIVVEGITDGRRGGTPPNFKMPKGVPKGMGSQMFGGSNTEAKTTPKPQGGGGDWKSVTMYWDVPCRYCTRAERWMRDRGIKFRSVRAPEGSSALETVNAAVRRNHGTKDRWPTFIFGGGSIMQGWNASQFERKARR